jgi:hypothetical protein
VIKTSIIDTMGGGNEIKANKAFQHEYGFSIDDLRSAQFRHTSYRSIKWTR